MTDHRGQALMLTADQITMALLEVAASARWPHGPLLLDLDAAVVREQLAPRLVAALVTARAEPGTPPPRGGPNAQPQPSDPHVCQEQPC